MKVEITRKVSDCMVEEWRTMTYKGETFNDYEVSNTGKIRSLNYKGHGSTKELQLYTEKSGYVSVRLSKNGRRKNYLVHRVVAFTWIENDEPLTKTQVNHIDEDKSNNCVENLEWLSPKNNVHHGTGVERRTKTQTNDERSKRVKCLETGVIYPSANECSRQTGLSQGNISATCNGKQKTTGGLHFIYVD